MKNFYFLKKKSVNEEYVKSTLGRLKRSPRVSREDAAQVCRKLLKPV